MKEFKHALRQVISGRRVIDDRIKYRVIGMVLAFIHLFFMLSFYTMHVTPLYLYNIAATIFYLYMSIVAVKNEQYVMMCISSLVEILFHSSMASLLLGWDWGFMIYTIALIPVVFYFSYTLPQFKGRVYSSAAASVLVCLCYILIRAVNGRIVPMYASGVPENAHTFFYYLNTMVALDTQIIFSVLFALEIRYMQNQLEKENRMLGKIANYDPLTRLLNRRSMSTYLKEAVEYAENNQQNFCLVLADIDDFKKFNDTYGHDCGDEVLVTVANMISGSVREDDYVCRWGGEEILVLLRADLEISVQIAERICRDIASNVINYKNSEVKVTLTMGASAYSPEKTIEAMIEEADQNLYRGKRNGKNQVVASET